MNDAPLPPAPAGHNSGILFTDPELLRDKLATDHEALRARAAQLLAAKDRLPAIADDETAGKIGDFIKQVTACAKALDAARVGAKEPYLQGGRAVDGWFKALTDQLDALKRTAQQPLTVYLNEKEMARRREAEEAAKRAHEEAERKAREAADAEAARQTPVAAAKFDAALAAEASATKLSEAAAAKPAEFARTRGDMGAVATLRERWVGEMVSREAIDLEALRPYLPTDAIQKAINAAIKAGIREIRGARIFVERTAAVS